MLVSANMHVHVCLGEFRIRVNYVCTYKFLYLLILITNTIKLPFLLLSLFSYSHSTLLPLDCFFLLLALILSADEFGIIYAILLGATKAFGDKRITEWKPSTSSLNGNIGWSDISSLGWCCNGWSWYMHLLLYRSDDGNHWLGSLGPFILDGLENNVVVEFIGRRAFAEETLAESKSFGTDIVFGSFDLLILLPSGVIRLDHGRQLRKYLVSVGLRLVSLCKDLEVGIGWLWIFAHKLGEYFDFFPRGNGKQWEDKAGLLSNELHVASKLGIWRAFIDKVSVIAERSDAHRDHVNWFELHHIWVPGVDEDVVYFSDANLDPVNEPELTVTKVVMASSTNVGSNVVSVDEKNEEVVGRSGTDAPRANGYLHLLVDILRPDSASLSDEYWQPELIAALLLVHYYIFELFKPSLSDSLLEIVIIFFEIIVVILLELFVGLDNVVYRPYHSGVFVCLRCVHWHVLAPQFLVVNKVLHEITLEITREEGQIVFFSAKYFF